MTKQEIKKMFNTCNSYHSCALCPYNPEDISRFIGDRWVGGCPDYDKKLVYAMSKGYRKGYRKAEEVRKETAIDFYSEMYDFAYRTKSYYTDALNDIIAKIDETFNDFRIELESLLREYGVEVE